jgi:hypothetical protein
MQDAETPWREILDHEYCMTGRNMLRPDDLTVENR